MNPSELQIHETGSGLQFRVHVLPRAKRCEISGIHNGALKIKVMAPPVDNAANRAIIEFLSSTFRLPKSSLQILAGARSRDKLLGIKGLSIQEFYRLLS
jgi:uncharacterized protein